MNVINKTTTSWHAARLRAVAPRALLYALVVILCIAGLRAIVAGPREPAPPPRVVQRGDDTAAMAFAESFTRAYLSWDKSNPDERARRLAPYVADWLGADAGLTPGANTSQAVSWSAVTGARRMGGRTIVTVAADTSAGMMYLSVPVARDGRGFLSVAGFPALVGPPATDRDGQQPDEEDVESGALKTVVQRAVTNYLAGARQNLVADLAPGAVVSMPAQHLQVTAADRLTWVRAGRRVAVQTEAEDQANNTWTLRYELDVSKRDRWYVQSIELDPTFQRNS